ncbi:MAG TPA: tRNA (adenosine(37)-N6)-threonylcarbamoyltransferase complex dimerization subunit type 1 TsaB [Candidatus Eisenbacteria bacterium]
MSRFVLGLDTASRHGSVALAKDGTAVAVAALPPGGHSSRLSTVAESLLAARHISLRDLAGISVAEGPGSFTGLRIGLAWAKGVATALATPLLLVSSHEALARAVRDETAAIATVLPGERGFVQVAFWEGGDEARLLFGPVSVPEADLPATLLERAEGRPGERPGVAAPDASPSQEASLLGARLTLLPARPAAGAVAELGDRSIREGRFSDPVTAAPAYGRAPNARRPTP